MSPVMGKGFPVEKAPPAEFPYLFIFATGTGIGPIKALIESHALKVCFIPIKQCGAPCQEPVPCSRCSMHGSALGYVASAKSSDTLWYR